MFKRFLWTFLCLVAVSSAQAQDPGLTSIIAPTAAALNCSTVPRTDSLKVRISNTGAAASNFTIGYILNGNLVTETYTGTVTASADYTFPTPLNTTSGGVNKLKVFVVSPTPGNDTLRFEYTPKINSFPYYEDFETDNGGFTAGGSNSSWTWGARNKGNTGKAGQGTNCWTNGGLNGTYYASDVSFLRSPCYDFTDLKNPYIAFKFLVEVEYSWEVITMQYSTNGGASWSNLGGIEPNSCDVQNWYNNGRPGWSGNRNYYPCSSWGAGCNGYGYCGWWTDARHCISNLAGQSNVMFQFAFTSTGSQCQGEGFALDSLVIAEAPSAVANANFTDSVCATVPVMFSASTSSCQTNPRWNFGDGSPTLSISPVAHAYKQGGNYNVQLIANGMCGRLDTLTKPIYIKPAPATTISGVPEYLCQTAAATALQGSPSGGTFTVDGIPGATVDPATLALGKHTAIYSFTDPASGCTIKDTFRFEVYLPTAKIDNLGGQYCPSAPSFKLKGSPAGGTFSINGVIDSIFNPAALGLGTHTVVYSYEDSVGCPASATQNVDIQNNLVVNIDPLSATYCAGDAAVPLSGNPTGGQFFVNDSLVTDFDPQRWAATAGPDTIVYYYSDGSCSNSDTIVIDVIRNLPAINGLNPVYCSDANTVTLSATPAGGVFTIDGATAFNLNPKTLSPGAHTVVYTYQDPVYGCIDSVKQVVTIDKPVVNISGVLPNYCINAAPVTPIGAPAGGVFTISGNTVTTIDPQVLGTGDYKLIYTFTNGNNCTGRDTVDIHIAPLPDPEFVNLDKSVCFNSPAVAINTNPSGGLVTIDGLPSSTNTFDPSVYASGEWHVIEYTYVDFAYGCVSSIVDSIFIGIPPTVTINGVEAEYCNTDQTIVLNGTPAGGQFTVNGTNATSFNPSQLGPGTHTVKYTYQDANGCQNEITQIVDITDNPGDTITPGPQAEICRGESLTLSVNGSLPGIWSTNETSASITVSPNNDTYYWYKVNVCASYYDTTWVKVHDNPQADFTLNPSEGFAPLNVTAKNQTQGSSTVEKWTFEGTDESTVDPATHTFTQPGTFIVQLIVTNPNGCKDTIEKEVNVFDDITVPNVFTPNNDGVNDMFGPKTAGAFDEYSFKIFNRWGNLMFDATQPGMWWNGDYKGSPAPEGTYFFILTAKNIKEFKIEGSVTLLR